jgi:hypothetical protein
MFRDPIPVVFVPWIVIPHPSQASAGTGIMMRARENEHPPPREEHKTHEPNHASVRIAPTQLHLTLVDHVL